MAPTLPPKAGYIEIEIDGVRQYQKITTEEDAQIQDLQNSLTEQQSINASLMLEIAKIKAGVMA